MPEMPVSLESENNIMALPADEAGVVLNQCFRTLDGRIMTIVESAIPDGPQSRATKDLTCQAVWRTYNEIWDELATLADELAEKTKSK